METRIDEKPDAGLVPEAQFHYAYHRMSTYDPNMCSTARFSPPYNSNQNEVIDQSYDNIILVPCNDDKVRSVHEGQVMTPNEPTGAYSIAENRSYVEYNRPLIEQSNPVMIEPRTSHLTEGVDGSNIQTLHLEGHAIQANPNSYIHEIAAPEHGQEGCAMTQIILHRSPNGHLYQNFYVNGDIPQTEMVELVQVNENVYEEHYIHPKESHVINPIEYPSKIPTNDEIMEPLTEAGFVHFGPSIIPDQGSEFLTDSYPISNNHLPSMHKDQQRILLESTMSPLLAAVNDITQRDAELQSYLNQTVDKAHSNIIFSSDAGGNRPTHGPVDGIHNASSEFVDINDVRTKKQHTEVSKDADDDFLLVSDKPVESRARASLPTNYLCFGKSKDGSGLLQVLAKKEIPSRAKFGPFEGEVHYNITISSEYSSQYPILFLPDSKILAVSNENTSNWMRFVRLAQTYCEQNLLLFEDNGKLYFKCCRTINAKEELKVGYSEEYAQLYNLRYLTPNEQEIREIYEKDNPWVCFECDQRFPTSNDMQTHLNIHECDENADVVSNKRKKKVRKKKIHLKRVDVRKNSSRCCYCLKVFMTSVSLKKHMAVHLAEKRNGKSLSKNTGSESNYALKCNVCSKRFSTEEKLKNHRLIHIKNDIKPYQCPDCPASCSTPAALYAHVKSHTNPRFTCIFCSESFKHVIEFKNHVALHSVNGYFDCNFCKKKYRQYYLVRKHVRICHSSQKYSCDICDRQFLNLYILKRHKVSHSEKREFLCSECGRQFKRKDKLREHITRMHSEHKKSNSKKKRIQKENPVSDGSQYLELSPKKVKPTKAIKNHSNDYHCYIYKCNDCMLGFKRRGMLVNHMAKRHPDIRIESIPELNLPIIKPQSLFYCQHCTKVYKSNAKRKAHILKNHPGLELPPSARNNSEPAQIHARTIGSLKTEPQRCQWCYKQYASRNRLLLHYRKSHPDKQIMDNIKQEFTQVEPLIIENNYRPPQSPENKLLKLSSAALELSSIEDRKFFDFLNERSQDPNSLATAGSLEDNANGFSKVDVNFKVVDGEFSETSSNAEINRLPQLFEESIACI